VGDCICRWSLNYGQQEFRKLHQSFFSLRFGAGIGCAPSKRTGKPNYDWIERQNRFSVSATAEAVIKGL
jgi:hypothetical protein